MKKESVRIGEDGLLDEYDLSLLKGGVRGKYYSGAVRNTNLVLIEPELATLFPDSQSVNRALRVLVDAAWVAVGSKPRRRK